MASYHVGCGIAGIYAGTLKKNGEEWLNKTDVTNEAIGAVVQHMYYKIPKNETALAYAFKMNNGKRVRLILEVADDCPVLAKGTFEERAQG